MKRKNVGLTIIILGFIILTAGFVPLTRRIIVTEEKIVETIEYRDEIKTREESYTQEDVIGTEPKEEELLKESIPVTRGSTLGKTFVLTAGDIIIFKAHSDYKMMISFTGQGEIYMSIEVGTDIEKEFTIKEDGEHTLLYSSASVTQDLVIDFDIVRIYEEPITETVEKTRTVEYTEKVPYTVDVPITEKTAKEEQYTIHYLRYAGCGVVLIGVVLCIMMRKPKPKKKRK